MVVLDSDILIDILRENKDTINSIDRLEKSGSSLCITVINAFELFEGAIILENEKKFVKVENLIKSFVRCYNFDGLVSWKAAEISADLKKRGQTLNFEDIAIAAICIAHGETLMTRNTRHFKRVRSLNLEKW